MYLNSTKWTTSNYCWNYIEKYKKNWNKKQQRISIDNLQQSLTHDSDLSNEWYLRTAATFGSSRVTNMVEIIWQNTSKKLSFYLYTSKYKTHTNVIQLDHVVSLRMKHPRYSANTIHTDTSRTVVESPWDKERVSKV